MNFIATSDLTLKTSVTYNGTGSQTNFDFPFDYLRKAFVFVNVDNAQMTQGLDYEVEGRQVVFDTAPPSGTSITIYRETSTERLVSWKDASVLKASDMTISQVQNLHIIEEQQDWSRQNSIATNEADGSWEGRNRRLANIADPTAPKDAVTKQYMESVQGGFVQENTKLKDEATKQAGIATTKASEASTSASNASASATESKRQADLAKQWADEAKASATTADSRATDATNSATTATNKATAAATSATNAQQSASTATTKANEASTSASNAAASATTATTKATAASTSATNAANSATEAKKSENAAKEYSQQLGQLSDLKGVATSEEAKAGETNDKAMTPLRTTELIYALMQMQNLSNFNYSADKVLSSDKTNITVPAGLVLKVGSEFYLNESTVSLSANNVATATNRKGKDYYVYACISGDSLTFVLSANSTVPTGYTADNSRKIGGFHCLCVDVGSISGHKMTGYVAGDVIPASVWDLKHRPVGNPEGFVYCEEFDVWLSIYLLSWNGSKLVSVYGGVIADGTSSKKWHGEAFLEQLASQHMRLPWRHEFQMAAKGSNEETNISGSADPNTTGGHKDTANRRQVSHIGLEDACGVLWQWTMDLGFAGGSGWTESVYNSSVDSAQYGQTYGTLFRLLVGGSWAYGAPCGSRSANCNGASANVYDYIGCRAACEPRHRKTA